MDTGIKHRPVAPAACLNILGDGGLWGQSCSQPGQGKVDLSPPDPYVLSRLAWGNAMAEWDLAAAAAARVDSPSRLCREGVVLINDVPMLFLGRGLPVPLVLGQSPTSEMPTVILGPGTGCHPLGYDTRMHTLEEG